MPDDRPEDMEHDEEDIGRLFGVMPPAPGGWVAAAAELPRARRALADVESRFADEPARAEATARLEQALADAGVVPTPELVRAVRRHLGGS